MRPRVRLAMIAALGALAGGSPCSANSQLDWELAAFLRTYLGPDAASAGPVGVTRYTVAWADLNGDGYPEAVVYVTGSSWCGRAGCVLLILQRERTGFTLRGRTMVSRPPIGVLDSGSHDWRDMIVWSNAGGGASRATVLRFDGLRYVAQPSGHVWGRVLIEPDKQSTPLFPQRR